MNEKVHIKSFTSVYNDNTIDRKRLIHYLCSAVLCCKRDY